ncbi:unnamed protein product [Arabidopsis lyrata]|nr:unnamed protein product [Arabidopsis lyrata]
MVVNVCILFIGNPTQLTIIIAWSLSHQSLLYLQVASTSPLIQRSLWSEDLTMRISHLLIRYSIDSRFHTAQRLPSMPSEMASSVSNIIDKKIYIRECESETESETWFSWRPAMKVCKWVCNSVVTPDRIYFKTSKNCFVYDPDEDNWEKDDILNSKMWNAGECVIEGIQSCYYLPSLEMLFAYDTKQRFWKGVKGVGRLTDDVFSSRTMSYSGKVFVLLQKQLQEKNEIWCAEIKLERDKEGVVCGNVEWCCCVLEGQTVASPKKLSTC